MRPCGRAAVPYRSSSSRDRGDHPCSVHLADAVVALIGDVQVARCVQRHAAGNVQLRRRSRAAVPAVAAPPGSCHRGDHPRSVHLADAVGAIIGDVQVAGAVQRHADGVGQSRRNGRAAIPSSEAETPGSCHRGDHSRSVHLADAVVERIGDVQVARSVHRHASGLVQLRRRSRAAVPAAAVSPISRDRGDHSRSVHLADAVVVPIGDVQVAQTVRRHAGGAVQLRRNGRAAVPAEAARPVARHRGDHPRSVHLADAVVARIGDVQVARAVQRHATGSVQLRRHSRAAVPAEAERLARHRGDHPRGVHLADAAVAIIGDVQVARAVHRHALGGAQSRRSGRAAIPAEAAAPRDRLDNPVARGLRPGNRRRQRSEDQRRARPPERGGKSGQLEEEKRAKRSESEKGERRAENGECAIHYQQKLSHPPTPCQGQNAWTGFFAAGGDCKIPNKMR